MVPRVVTHLSSKRSQLVAGRPPWSQAHRPTHMQALLMSGVSLQQAHGVLFCTDPWHPLVGEGCGDWGSLGHRREQGVQRWVLLIPSSGSACGDAVQALG